MKLRNRLAAGIVSLCVAGALVADAQSENRHVRIINRSSSSIRYLYVTNVDSRSWGPDLLGDFNVLLPGYYIDEDMDDGTGHCIFDLRATLYDGRVAETRGFNACTQQSWTVYD
jgi:hypothetical protein